MLFKLISLSLVSLSVCYYHPTIWDKYQIQLSGSLDDSLKVWADLYDADLWGTTDHQISEIHAKGAKIICYFSAGSRDIQRPDAHLFHSSDLGGVYNGFPDETWLDIRSSNVKSIMAKRMDLAKSKHCDGIRPDNVNGYTPGNAADIGFSFQDQLDYNRWLADQAHSRDMSIGLINDVAQLNELHSWYDWALNEGCHTHHECSGYSAFLDEDKPVYNIEFVGDDHHVHSADRQKCTSDHPHGMRTQFKDWALSSWVERC